MTNPTPHGQVPEALRLAHIFDNPLPPEWPDMVAAAAELRRQHTRIAELEAQLEAICAGGVEPLRKISEQPAQTGDAVATQWLAEMIMSDCGCSTENQRLLDRIIDRIQKYDRASAAPQPSTAAQGDALSDAVRVPLDSLHADAAYLIGRLREGSMPYARVIEIIRERIDAAKAAIRARAAHGQAPADLSPTAGMNIAQRILHVGGRNNDAGYVEFGSIQAVEALVRQVLRDLPAPAPADSVLEDAARYRWLRINAIGAYRTNDGKGPVSVYHLSKIPAIPGIPEETDAAIDAARKQGANHD